MAITIWDRTGTVLFYSHADCFESRFEVGFKIPDGRSEFFEAMETGKVIHQILRKEDFGAAA